MTEAVRVRRWGLPAERIPYDVALAEQLRLHEAVVEGSEPSTVLLLEHPPVYTAGRRTEPDARPADGTPVIDVDRGGSITWHGPGQLVGYPIVLLPQPVDVVAHVRRMEEVILRSCAELGLAATRIKGRSGVWFPADSPAQGTRPERKVAAVGVRVARGVTKHGFALNCDCDLAWFDRIVPCGLADAGVTSLSAELGRRVTVEEAAAVVERHLAEVFDAVVPGRPLPTAAEPAAAEQAAAVRATAARAAAVQAPAVLTPAGPVAGLAETLPAALASSAPA
ncbi:MAG: lipoyl(octanoyl) transferase LipB [Actinomycetota bacterium]|nr:MAG: lipoyl(octanoyl) transferase LipB [Actinomycetota bacterium]